MIIAARNASHTLSDTLLGLAQQTLPPSEVIVVDDASTDGTGQLARSLGARLISVGQPDGAPVGPGPARLAGLVEATAAVVVFTDADCEPVPEFLERLTAPLTGPDTGAAKGAYRTRQSSLVARFVQIEFEERYARLQALPSTDFVDGHAAAYKRTALESVGGFDPDLRLSQNVDMGYRLVDAGWNVVFVPDAIVYHRHPESLWDYFRAKTERAFWRMHHLARRPGHLLTDSYTPNTLRLQVVLVVLAAALSMVSIISPVPNDLTLGLGFLYLASTLSFLARAHRSDPTVVAVVLPLLLARSVALAAGSIAGYIAGLASLRPGGRVSDVRDSR